MIRQWIYTWLLIIFNRKSFLKYIFIVDSFIKITLNELCDSTFWCYKIEEVC